MKNSILILLLLIVSNLMSNELSWVNEQIQAIKPPRIGMQNHDISSIRDPFIFLSNNKSSDKIQVASIKSLSTTNRQTTKTQTTIVRKKPTGPLDLGIILNNVAMINGNWYKIGDFVNGYKIVKIGRVSVTLNNQNKKLLLSTKSRNNKLKFQK